MRWNYFGASLLFAVLAGLGFPAVRLIFDPVFGPVFTTHFYLVSAAGLYALCIAPTLRRGIGAGALVTLLGTVLVLGGSGTRELSVGLAVGIAIARSALLYRRAHARSLAIEVALGFGGLLLARWFATPGLLAGALALWGYFLAQTVYFPLSASAPRCDEASGDAFDEARARLQSLLREMGVRSV